MDSTTLFAASLESIGIHSDLKIMVWNVLSGVLVALVIFFILTRESNLEKKQEKPAPMLLLIATVVFFVGIVGAGSYVLLLPQTVQNAPVAAQRPIKGQGFPVVGFPLTGSAPVSEMLTESLRSVYTSPVDGLITFLLILSVISLGLAAFHNISVTRKIEKELEDAKIAALNVYQDLQVEAQTLAEEKAKDEALLESIGEGLVAVDNDRRIMVINTVAADMLGWESKELIGKEITDLPLQDDAGTPVAFERRPTTRALATGQAVKDTFYFVRKDRTRFPLAITATPIKLAGEIIGLIEIIRDVTHEKEIDRAKTEFVSLASHQLRTPITAIHWYAEMLLAEEVGTLNAKQREYLAEIQHGNQRMIELVNTLLSVSRIELGGFGVQPGPTDVAAIADEVLKEFRVQISEKKLLLTRSYGADVPSIVSDPKMVRIIFENLLANAVTYTPATGKIFVTVNKSSTGVTIEIRDNGYGIPQNAQSKIYTKLFRAENAQAIKPDGTGLGLYITKSVVGALGGTISYTSKEGEGTAFTVNLSDVKMVDKRLPK